MDKEHLAQQYARELWILPEPSVTFTLSAAILYDNCKRDFLKGYEAAEPKWIKFEGKLLNVPMWFLFDNGEIRRSSDDDMAFAVMTHYLPIPELPKTEP